MIRIRAGGKIQFLDASSNRQAHGSSKTSRTSQSAGAEAAKLSARDVQELARKYAPIRYLHPKEKYKPAEPLDFIHASRLREDRGHWFDKTIFDVGQIDPAKLRGMHKDNLYLDLRDKKVRWGNSDRAPTFYQFGERSRTMTYWFFYAYNETPKVRTWIRRFVSALNPILTFLMSRKLDHQGDWERITIQFDRHQKPTEVRYSVHEGHVTRSWTDAPKEGTRPIVYVAKGSHANSPAAKTTVAIRIKFKKVGLAIVKDHYGRGQRVDSARHPLRDVTAELRYGTSVHWGKHGKLALIGQEFTSGPAGPSPSKGALL